ncbi:MAG: LuxR C-terminal-related transcriptional regulator [Ilumatobacteraceae bacterium]
MRWRHPAGDERVGWPLPGREHEILERIARGDSNRTIADRLGLSPKTIANNLSNIFTKLHVTDRTQAVVRARDAGLGHPPPPQRPGASR